MDINFIDNHFINNNYYKLMKTISQHLEEEKKKIKPTRIEQLSKILKRGTITLEEWRMTGRFMPAEEYLHENKNVELLKDCKEVIEYAGASIIQVLHTGIFVFKDTKSKSLDEVEDVLWKEVCEKLWCENC